MIKVYHFKGWDQLNGVMVYPPLKSTLHRIQMIGCEVIQGSMEEVAPTALDPEGRYIGMSRSNRIQ